MMLRANKMRNTLQWILIIFLVSFYVNSNGQSTVSSYPGLVTVNEYLSTRGIRTRLEVITALTGGDATIRGIAAYKLAQDHDVDAVSLLTSAFTNEKDPHVKVDLASALWTVKEEGGQSRLEHFCEDQSIDDSVALEATRQLALRGMGGACIPRIMALYLGTSETGRRLELLGVLSGVASNVPMLLEASLLEVGRRALQDSDPSVRLASISLLTAMKTDNANNLLSDAQKTERDPIIKRRLDEAAKAAGSAAASKNRSSNVPSSSKPQSEAAGGGSPCLTQTCPISVSLSDATLEPLAPLVPRKTLAGGLTVNVLSGLLVGNDGNYHGVTLVDTNKQ